MDLETLKDVYYKRSQIIKYIKELDNGIYDLNIEEFLYAISFLTPQSFGSKLQKFIQKRLSLTTIKPSLDMGDAVDSDGFYCEIKCSLINDTNKTINIVQIRPWHNIKYYFIGVFDVIDGCVTIFKLTKQQMIDECVRLKATSAHMTKKSIENNKNVELRLGIPINSDVYQQWVDLYRYNV